MISFKRTQQFISFLLSVFFLVNVSFGANPEKNFWDSRRSALAASSSAGSVQMASLPNGLSAMPSLTKSLVVPSNPMGMLDIKKSTLRYSKSVAQLLSAIPLSSAVVGDIYDVNDISVAPIVLLQDVHLNPEAQHNLSSIMNSLIDKKYVGFVGVEGAFERFDFDLFQKFPDADLSRKVATEFVNNKQLAAPSYVGVTWRKKDLPLFRGIDHRKLYNQNVEAYLLSRRQRAKAISWLEAQDRIIQKQRQRLFKGPLNRFADHFERYKKGTLGFGDYLAFLSDVAPEENISLSVEQFLQAYHIEKTLNFSLVEKERNTVLSALLPKLSAEEAKQLMASSLQFRSQTMTPAAFFSEIRSLCKLKGIDLKQTPSFESYIHYVLLSESINPQSLFSSVAHLEERTIEPLLASQGKENTHEVWQHFEQSLLLSRLLNFELTPGEWVRYKELAELQPLPLVWAPFEDFYEKADKRSQAMLKNSLLNQPQQGSPLLVMGGFHTEEVTRLLKKNRLPYVVISPRLTKLDDSGSSYLSVFAQNKTPLDLFFSGKKLFLSPENQNITNPNTAIRLHAEQVSRLPSSIGYLILNSRYIFPLLQRYFGQITQPLVNAVGLMLAILEVSLIVNLFNLHSLPVVLVLVVSFPVLHQLLGATLEGSQRPSTPWFDFVGHLSVILFYWVVSPLAVSTGWIWAIPVVNHLLKDIFAIYPQLGIFLVHRLRKLLHLSDQALEKMVMSSFIGSPKSVLQSLDKQLSFETNKFGKLIWNVSDRSPRDPIRSAETIGVLYWVLNHKSDFVLQSIQRVFPSLETKKILSVNIQYLAHGAHKDVYRLDLKTNDGLTLPFIFSLAFKTAQKRGDISETELDALKLLHGFSGVPRFGGDMKLHIVKHPKGVEVVDQSEFDLLPLQQRNDSQEFHFYIEEFISGPLAMEIHENNTITDVHRRALAKLLMNIRARLGNRLPRDLHRYNFVFRNGDPNDPVCIDLGEMLRDLDAGNIIGQIITFYGERDIEQSEGREIQNSAIFQGIVDALGQSHASDFFKSAKKDFETGNKQLEEFHLQDEQRLLEIEQTINELKTTIQVNADQILSSTQKTELGNEIKSNRQKIQMLIRSVRKIRKKMEHRQRDLKFRRFVLSELESFEIASSQSSLSKRSDFKSINPSPPIEKNHQSALHGFLNWLSLTFYNHPIKRDTAVRWAGLEEVVYSFGLIVLPNILLRLVTSWLGLDPTSALVIYGLPSFSLMAFIFSTLRFALAHPYKTTWNKELQTYVTHTSRTLSIAERLKIYAPMGMVFRVVFVVLALTGTQGDIVFNAAAFLFAFAAHTFWNNWGVKEFGGVAGALTEKQKIKDRKNAFRNAKELQISQLNELVSLVQIFHSMIETNLDVIWPSSWAPLTEREKNMAAQHVQALRHIVSEINHNTQFKLLDASIISALEFFSRKSGIPLDRLTETIYYLSYDQWLIKVFQWVQHQEQDKQIPSPLNVAGESVLIPVIRRLFGLYNHQFKHGVTYRFSPMWRKEYGYVISITSGENNQGPSDYVIALPKGEWLKEFPFSDARQIVQPLHFALGYGPFDLRLLEVFRPSSYGRAKTQSNKTVQVDLGRLPISGMRLKPAVSDLGENERYTIDVDASSIPQEFTTLYVLSAEPKKEDRRLLLVVEFKDRPNKSSRKYIDDPLELRSYDLVRRYRPLVTRPGDVENWLLGKEAQKKNGRHKENRNTDQSLGETDDESSQAPRNGPYSQFNWSPGDMIDDIDWLIDTLHRVRERDQWERVRISVPHMIRLFLELDKDHDLFAIMLEALSSDISIQQRLFVRKQHRRAYVTGHAVDINDDIIQLNLTNSLTRSLTENGKTLLRSLRKLREDVSNDQTFRELLLVLAQGARDQHWSFFNMKKRIDQVRKDWLTINGDKKLVIELIRKKIDISKIAVPVDSSPRFMGEKSLIEALRAGPQQDKTEDLDAENIIEKNNLTNEKIMGWMKTLSLSFDDIKTVFDLLKEPGREVMVREKQPDGKFNRVVYQMEFGDALHIFVNLGRNVTRLEDLFKEIYFAKSAQEQNPNYRFYLAEEISEAVSLIMNRDGEHYPWKEILRSIRKIYDVYKINPTLAPDALNKKDSKLDLEERMRKLVFANLLRPYYEQLGFSEDDKKLLDQSSRRIRDLGLSEILLQVDKEFISRHLSKWKARKSLRHIMVGMEKVIQSYGKKTLSPLKVGEVSDIFWAAKDAYEKSEFDNARFIGVISKAQNEIEQGVTGNPANILKRVSRESNVSVKNYRQTKGFVSIEEQLNQALASSGVVFDLSGINSEDDETNQLDSPTDPLGGSWFAHRRYMTWVAWWFESFVAMAGPLWASTLWAENFSIIWALFAALIFWLPHGRRGSRVLFSWPVVVLSVLTGVVTNVLLNDGFGWSSMMMVGALVLFHALINRLALEEKATLRNKNAPSIPENLKNYGDLLFDLQSRAIIKKSNSTSPLTYDDLIPIVKWGLVNFKGPTPEMPYLTPQATEQLSNYMRQKMASLSLSGRLNNHEAQMLAQHLAGFLGQEINSRNLGEKNLIVVAHAGNKDLVSKILLNYTFNVQKLTLYVDLASFDSDEQFKGLVLYRGPVKVIPIPSLFQNNELNIEVLENQVSQIDQRERKNTLLIYSERLSWTSQRPFDQLALSSLSDMDYVSLENLVGQITGQLPALHRICFATLFHTARLFALHA